MRQAILKSRVVGSFAEPSTTCPLVSCTGLQLAGRGEVCVDKHATAWPERTELLCWHCAQRFDTPPVPRPVRYDRRTQRWTVRGNYCCWGCAAADCRSQAESSCLQGLHQAVFGRERAIRTVPPKVLLQPFGGPLTVEEYRSSEQEFRVVPSRLVQVEPVKIEAENSTRTRMPITVDFSNVTASNEVLKMKRTKPLAAGRGLPMHARIVR